ncbi:hypothetical protein OH77DRAFT_1279732 [Trametes cingulata]|nr:hypothetical protein OH77DRAFT_1279732 [Trametes cingulata]
MSTPPHASRPLTPRAALQGNRFAAIAQPDVDEPSTRERTPLSPPPPYSVVVAAPAAAVGNGDNAFPPLVPGAPVVATMSAGGRGATPPGRRLYSQALAQRTMRRHSEEMARVRAARIAVIQAVLHEAAMADPPDASVPMDLDGAPQVVAEDTRAGNAEAGQQAGGEVLVPSTPTPPIPGAQSRASPSSSDVYWRDDSFVMPDEDADAAAAPPVQVESSTRTTTNRANADGGNAADIPPPLVTPHTPALTLAAAPPPDPPVVERPRKGKKRARLESSSPSPVSKSQS